MLKRLNANKVDDGRWALWLIVLGAALLVVGAFIAVGFRAGRHDAGRFDWELASIFGTAVGTSLLALATGALAWSTARDVSATRKLADIAAADQLSRDRPVLAGSLTSARQYDRRPGAGVLEGIIQNIGFGPALDVILSAAYKDDEYEIAFDPRKWTPIQPGQVVTFNLLFRFDWPDDVEETSDVLSLDAFTPVGECVDRFGNKYTAKWRPPDTVYGQWVQPSVN